MLDIPKIIQVVQNHVTNLKNALILAENIGNQVEAEAIKDKIAKAEQALVTLRTMME
jgi:hypothetical protein